MAPGGGKDGRRGKILEMVPEGGQEMVPEGGQDGRRSKILRWGRKRAGCIFGFNIIKRVVGSDQFQPCDWFSYGFPMVKTNQFLKNDHQFLPIPLQFLPNSDQFL